MTLFSNNFSAIFYLHLLIDVLYLKDVYAENDKQTIKEKNHNWTRILAKWLSVRLRTKLF